MEFGVSLFLEKPDLISDCVEAGFDYLDTSVKKLATYTDEEFEVIFERAKALPIPIRHGLSLFPSEIMLVGPNRDFQKINEYLDLALTRITKLGAKIIVLGSGDSRRIPEGATKEQTLNELKEVCEKCIAPAARKFGVTIVIEPLCRKETDIINTIEEAVEFHKTLNLPEFRMLADGYHMKQNGEEYSEIEKTGSELLVTHIANPEGRDIPYSKDGDIYQGFFQALRNIGYDGSVTCEGRLPKGDETVSRLEMLKDCVTYLRKQ